MLFKERIDELTKKLRSYRTPDEDATWLLGTKLDDITEAKYKRLKVKLQELSRILSRKTMISLFIVFSLIASYIMLKEYLDYYGLAISDIDIPMVLLSLLLGSVLGGFLLAYIFLAGILAESELRTRILVYEAEHLTEEVNEDIFENSIKMSYKYLDQYYLQTREQAQRGFLVTVCVAIFGALLIGVGIVTMFLGLTEPSYVTCATGVITEFISAIFFYLYNKTVSSMTNYHNKLVLSHNISIALKVAESLLDDEKAKAKTLIVTELMKDINNYLVQETSQDDKSK